MATKETGNWTAKDRDKVREILTKTASKFGSGEAARGGKTKLSQLLNLSSRQILDNWYRRGQVPMDYHRTLILLASPEQDVMPAQLHPDAKRALHLTRERAA